MISLWVAGNLVLYFKFGIDELGHIIDFNNAFIIIIVAFVFLFWGILSSLKDWIRMFEKRLELWIFQKYINLPELIEKNKTQLAEVTKTSNPD